MIHSPVNDDLIYQFYPFLVVIKKLSWTKSSLINSSPFGQSLPGLWKPMKVNWLADDDE